MKRMLGLMIILSLLLCGCGAKPGMEEMARPGAVASLDAAAVERAEWPEMEEMSLEETLESLYHREGNFFFPERDWEFIAEQPKDELLGFAVRRQPDAGMDERLEKWSEPMMEMELAYELAEEELGEEYRQRELEEFMEDESVLARLPLDWTEKIRAGQEAFWDYGAYLDAYEELEREYAIAAAEDFAARGIKAEVRAEKSLFEGREQTAYACIVYMRPEELIELSREMDFYFVERLWESVDIRFDIAVWPEGGEGLE